MSRKKWLYGLSVELIFHCSCLVFSKATLLFLWLKFTLALSLTQRSSIDSFWRNRLRSCAGSPEHLLVVTAVIPWRGLSYNIPVFTKTTILKNKVSQSYLRYTFGHYNWARILKEQIKLKHEKTYFICATDEDSDQPAHPRSLIRAFFVRIRKLLCLNMQTVPCNDSDQTARISDLNLRCLPMSEGAITKTRLYSFDPLKPHIYTVIPILLRGAPRV